MKQIHNKLHWLALIFGLYLFPMMNLMAQNIEIIPNGGWYFGGKLHTSTGELNIRNDIHYGISLNYAISRHSWVEIFYTRYETRVDKKSFYGGTEKLFDLYQNNYQIGIIQTVKRMKKMTTYVTGSMGTTQFQPVDSEFDDDWRFSLSLGGGLKYYFSKRIGLRLDGRFYMPVYWGSGGIYGGSGGSGIYLSAGSIMLQGYLSAGLIFVL